MGSRVLELLTTRTHKAGFATMVRVLEFDTLKSLIAPLLQQKISPATVLHAHRALPVLRTQAVGQEMLFFFEFFFF